MKTYNKSPAKSTKNRLPQSSISLLIQRERKAEFGGNRKLCRFYRGLLKLHGPAGISHELVE